MDKAHFELLSKIYDLDNFYIVYSAIVKQERKLIKALVRRGFDRSDWRRIYDVIEDICDSDDDDSVTSCAACALSSLSAHHNPHSTMLYGLRFEMWNEDDEGAGE